MSKSIKAYQSGFSFLLSSKKIWFLIYGLNVGFAILVALPLNNYLKSTISDSLATNNEFLQFNYTYISDFLANYGSGLEVVFNTSIYILLSYFIIMVFISGGMVTIIQNRDKYQEFSNFWKGGAVLFWRFLRLDFYFILIYLVIAAIGFSIFQFGGLSVFEMESETGLINRFYIIAIVMSILFFILGIIHIYAKLFISKTNKILIHKDVLKAFTFCIKNFGIVILLGIINLLVFGIFAGFYFWFRKHYYFSNSPILLLLVIGQLFILFRIACRIIRAASFEALSRGE